MKKMKVNLKNIKNIHLKVIVILLILLIILIISNILNITDKNYTEDLEKNYIQNEFLDYSLIDILQGDDYDNAKASFAYKYAEKDLETSAITEDVYKYYYKCLFNEEPNSTAIVDIQASIQTYSPEPTDLNVENNEEGENPEQSSETQYFVEPIFYEYRCFLTDLEKEKHNKYVATADIVTTKNDPMVTTPFSDIATPMYSAESYALATATSENYTDYTEIVGKVILYLEKVENRFVITNWNVNIDD